MQPLAITLGNVLFTIWIVGGFLALLFLVRAQPAEVASSEQEVPAGSVPEPRETVAPIVPQHRPQAVRDVYWERRHSESDEQPREAA